MTDMQGDELDALRTAIAQCRICRDQPARGPDDRLPHEPRPISVISPAAKIMIASQAPGLRAHNSGIPFNDASGDRLRQWLDVTRAQFYEPRNFAIVPMGFCFPGYDALGSDMPPRKECMPRWRSETIAAMPQIELVLAIGQYAQAWHLGDRRASTMTETVRNWRTHLGTNTGPAVLAMPHPSWRNTAWLKKNPWFADEVLPVLQNRVKKLIV